MRTNIYAASSAHDQRSLRSISATYSTLQHIGADPERALTFARTWVANTRRQDTSEGGFWDDTVLLLIQGV